MNTSSEYLNKLHQTDLTTNIAGIISPNPFWLASAPPTNCGSQVMRAFELGWGGAVWKTLGKPIQNVSSRLSALDFSSKKMFGLNNIELITDRPIEDNLREMMEVKKRFPKHTLVASLMVETKREWQEIIKQVEDAGADAIELNFGCPHGMCERGMGSAVGQEPQVLEKITGWTKEFAKVPVIVKLTPNITDVTIPALAAKKAGADAVSLINTIKSVINVDIDRFIPQPIVDNKSTNGGYCGPAVKPIALHMVGSIARKNYEQKLHSISLPISGIGGISTWKDAVEFLLMGASNVQICTAVMHYGYRIIEDMIQGLTNYMIEKGFHHVHEITGKAVSQFSDWGNLNLEFKQVAHIHSEHCIGCNLCVVACDDGGHQCIDLGKNNSKNQNSPALPAKNKKMPMYASTPINIPNVRHEDCVGCNLCMLVCPSPGAITMEKVESMH